MNLANVHCRVRIRSPRGSAQHAADDAEDVERGKHRREEEDRHQGNQAADGMTKAS